MKRDSVVAIVGALNDNRVQYLIVGGLAVVAHIDLFLEPPIDFDSAYARDSSRSGPGHGGSVL